MHTRTSIVMNAPFEEIYSLAANIEKWPDLLPHYRSVNLLERSDNGYRKVADMAAVRDDFPLPGARFPVRWHCVQICEPDERRITFKHLQGIALGMWVVWSFEPAGGGVNVSIDHTLRYPIELLNGWFAQYLVGKLFVEAIAGRTLETFKQIVENRA